MEMSLRENRKEKIIFMAILTVLIIIMSFTPLGYLKMLRASITFLPVVVVVGAVQYRCADFIWERFSEFQAFCIALMKAMCSDRPFLR